MEFKGLDGRELIYTDELEKLVQFTYRGRQLPRQKSYRVVCPRCLERNRLKGTLPYTKTNLSISSDFTIGHCYRCDAVFINELGSSNAKVTTDLYFNDNHYEVPNYNCESLITSSPANLIVESIEYLHKRNPYINPVDFRLGWKSNKIFIPFYIDGKLCFYQIRYIKPFVEGMKYFTPPIDHKPFYIPLCDGRYFWKPEIPTILVEGAFTAIAVRCILGNLVNVAALLGKSLTDYQKWLLNYLGYSKILVMMDSSELSNNLINSNYDLKLGVIPSDGQDAEECLNSYGYDNYKNYLLKYLKSQDLNLKFNSNEFINDYVDQPIKTEFKLGKSKNA